jgi:hypothetical protein
MAISILPYHRTPSDIKFCLAFLIVPANDLGLMFLVMGMLDSFYVKKYVHLFCVRCLAIKD